MTTAAPLVVLPPITLGDPAQLDLQAYRGDTGRFRVLVLQDAAPLDVSAATWDCDIRGTADGALMASMTVTPVAGTTNAVDVELSAASSGTLPAGEAVWDLEMTVGVDPDTTVTTLLRGAIVVTADVSRVPFEPPDTGGGGVTVLQDGGDMAARGASVAEPPSRAEPGPVVVGSFEQSVAG